MCDQTFRTLKALVDNDGSDIDARAPAGGLFSIWETIFSMGAPLFSLYKAIFFMVFFPNGDSFWAASPPLQNFLWGPI